MPSRPPTRTGRRVRKTVAILRSRIGSAGISAAVDHVEEGARDADPGATPRAQALAVGGRGLEHRGTAALQLARVVELVGAEAGASWPERRVGEEGDLTV